MKNAYWLLGFALAAAAAGCSGGTEETSAPGDLSGADFALEPTADDVYRVGALDGEDWEIFGRVTAVMFDHEGNLFILDSDVGRVAVVAPDGSFLRTIGNQGGGPGEFQAMFGATVLPDGGLTVFDLGKQGFQLFDPAGQYINSVPVDLTAGTPGMEMAALPDGRIVSAGGFRMPGGDGPPDPDDLFGSGPTRPVDRFSLEDGGHDVLYEAWQLPAAPVGDRQTLESEGGGQITFSMGTRAYEPALHFGALSDGRVAVVDSLGFRIKLIDEAGNVASTLERPLVPMEATDRVQAAERDRRLAALEEQEGGRVMMLGGGGGMQIDQEQMRQMMVNQVEQMEFAAVVPVISGLAVDRSDRLWVRRFGPDGEEGGPTDILSADGHYFGTVSADGFPTPDAFGPDNLIAYIETDDLGVQTVRVARLAPF